MTRTKGWYYQLAGKWPHLGDRVIANDHQSKACIYSNNLLHPPLGHQYNKAAGKGSQPSLMKVRLAEFERPQDILNYIQSILTDLVYSPEKRAKTFEIALSKLGDFLGFDQRMPGIVCYKGSDFLCF